MNINHKSLEENLTISIGVITKNRPEKLSQCLRSLLNQSIQPDKIIIVDGSINEYSKDIVFKNFSQKKKSNIWYIRQKKRGISNARNIVLDNATTELVGFIDDDGEADYRWVETMVKAHTRHPEAVIVQGQCVVVSDKSVVAYVYQNEYNAWLEHNFDSKGYLLRANIENSSINIKKINKKIRFDEESKNYYGDDIDFSYQIISQKYKIFYNPKSITKIKIRGVFSLMLKRLSKGHSAAIVDIKWQKFQNQQVLILRGILFRLKSTDSGQNRHRQVIELPGFNKLEKMMITAIYFFYTYLYKASYNYWYFIKSNYIWPNKVKDLYLLSSPYQETRLSLSRLPSSTIGIIVKDSESLKKLLPILLSQSILPRKIIFSIQNQDHLSKDIIKTIEKKIICKTIMFGSNKLNTVNKMINTCDTDIICLISSDQLPSYFWNESFIKAHAINSKIPVIQGQRLFKKDLFSLGLVSQFLWQTLMRNSVSSGKEYYSKVLEGDKRYNKFKIIDSDNFSVKITRDRINFKDKESELKTLLQMAINLFQLKKPVFMEINAKTLTFNTSFLQIIKKGYTTGSSLMRSSDLLFKNQQDLLSWNIFKKITAFLYFGLKRKAYIQLPVLTTIYIIYLVSFYIGILVQKKQLQR